MHEPETPLPSCQVELYTNLGSGCAKHSVGGQGVAGVTACHLPRKVQNVLFVSSMVMFVEAANTRVEKKVCKMSATPALKQGKTMVVANSGLLWSWVLLKRLDRKR